MSNGIDRSHFDSPSTARVIEVRIAFLDRAFVLQVPNVETVIVVKARQLNEEDEEEGEFEEGIRLTTDFSSSRQTPMVSGKAIGCCEG